MAKQRIHAIEYIRGISMLGVVGIHTGAYSLSNPQINIHFFAILEIFTRFSVPIFFFVSAFGLFFKQTLDGPFAYIDFLKRRIRTVLLPYVVWSLLYMLHNSFVSGDWLFWSPPLIYEYFLFGLASYQLYFLVILLWFYLMMPIWRILVRHIIRNPLSSLTILLAFQVAFNYYSSYLLTANFENRWLNLAIQYRLSYWVIHYIFIFLLGAVAAIKYNAFSACIQKYRRTIHIAFFLCLIGMLGYYYDLLYFSHYTREEAVNTAHQLSPIGVLYTLAATLFWFELFSRTTLPRWLINVLDRLGSLSYHVYLIHPVVMFYLMGWLANQEIIMRVPVAAAFFLITVSFSLLAGLIIDKASTKVPLIGLMLVGAAKKK